MAGRRNAGPAAPAAARLPKILERLAATYPGTATELCALRHQTPFQLLVATILSAQCTDVRVNMVVPAVFDRYPDAAALAGAEPADLEELIRTTGFFRAKARNLIGMARALVERFDGGVPESLEDLVTLPGVGRKTGNVVRSVAFGLPGLPVDTHVGRLARRLALTTATDPVKVERDLDVVPPAERGACSLRLILHGRAVCRARSPQCGICVLADLCPSATPAGPGASRAREAASRSGRTAAGPGPAGTRTARTSAGAPARTAPASAGAPTRTARTSAGAPARTAPASAGTPARTAPASAGSTPAAGGRRTSKKAGAVSGRPSRTTARTSSEG